MAVLLQAGKQLRQQLELAAVPHLNSSENDTISLVYCSISAGNISMFDVRVLHLPRDILATGPETAHEQQ